MYNQFKFFFVFFWGVVTIDVFATHPIRARARVCACACVCVCVCVHFITVNISKAVKTHRGLQTNAVLDQTGQDEHFCFVTDIHVCAV